MSSEIEKEKEHILKLKEDLELKKKFLELLKEYGRYPANSENSKKKSEIDEKIKKELNKHLELEGYFHKFPFEQHDKKIVYPIMSKSAQNYSSSRHLNQILEDLERIKKEILDREYLLQQKLFLEKQQEFLEIQKQDIEENKKDRKMIVYLTMALAFGALASIIFYMFQTFVQFKTSPTLHILLASGISCLALTILFIFVINIFNKEMNLMQFIRKSLLWIIILALLIGIFSFYLMTTQDKPTTFAKNAELDLLNQTNRGIQDINSFLNQSIGNQEEMKGKLDTIILNQINNSEEK